MMTITILHVPGFVKKKKKKKIWYFTLNRHICNGILQSIWYQIHISYTEQHHSIAFVLERVTKTILTWQTHALLFSLVTVEHKQLLWGPQS